MGIHEKMLQEIIEYSYGDDAKGDIVCSVLEKGLCIIMLPNGHSIHAHVHIFIRDIDARKKVFGEGMYYREGYGRHVLPEGDSLRQHHSKQMSVMETRQEQLKYLYSFLPNTTETGATKKRKHL